MQAGRKIKTHTFAGQQIPGLSRQADLRWRIYQDGKRTLFTEPDEFLAVAKARKILGLDRVDTFEITAEYIPTDSLPTAIEPRAAVNGRSLPIGIVDTLASAGLPDGLEAELTLGYQIPERALWNWLAKMLKTKPEFLAEKTGDGRLMRLRNMPGGVDVGISISEIISTYRQNSKSGSKETAIKNFLQLAKFTNAKNLNQLTTEKLLEFRNYIENESNWKSGEGKKWFYGTLKSIISFGRKMGLDTQEIDATLSRMKVLWTSSPTEVRNPTPISKADFQKLLSNANPQFKAMLLIGLNCCLHLGEVVELKWDGIDLEAGTYAVIREKTKEDRIPRAAVLWKETIEALKALPRKHEIYVFVSTTGKRYNRNSRGNKFCKLREKAGVSDEVTFDWLKDGGYTAAVNAPGVEEKFARVLAGQRATGCLDRYVLRFPQCVAGACAAVHQYYFA